MNQDDKAKIEKIAQDRKTARQSFLDKDSKVYKAFLDLPNLVPARPRRAQAITSNGLTGGRQ